MRRVTDAPATKIRLTIMARYFSGASSEIVITQISELN